MVDLGLPEVRHAHAALRFVAEDRRRLLVLSPHDLAAPDRESVQHASRHGLETARLPPLVTRRQIENRFTVEVIEPGADDGGFLQPDAVVTNEIGHAARWIDAVVRTVRETGLGKDDLDPALQSLLENHDTHHARVGRARGDVEFHIKRSCRLAPSIGILPKLEGKPPSWTTPASIRALPLPVEGGEFSC